LQEFEAVNTEEKACGEILAQTTTAIPLRANLEIEPKKAISLNITRPKSTIPIDSRTHICKITNIHSKKIRSKSKTIKKNHEKEKKTRYEEFVHTETGLEMNEEDFYKSFSIEILRGENLLVPKTSEPPIVGNPFLRISVKTKKGKKIRNTKVKLKETNPTWNEEKFSFHGIIFPVECICMSNRISVRKKTTKPVEEQRHSSSKEVIGHFLIEKDHLPKPNQTPLQRWYLLETFSTAQSIAKILVQISASKE